MTKPTKTRTKVRGHDVIWKDGEWHVYSPDGKLRGTFQEKADVSLFLLKSTTEERSAGYQKRMRQADLEDRVDGQVPIAYGTLLMTGNPFIWHFAVIVLVFLFVVGVGIPIVSNVLNWLFGTGRAANTIQLSQLFSSISLLYLAVLTLGAILLVILRSTGLQGGIMRPLLVGGLFNAGLFGLLLIGIISMAAIVLGIFGLFGFEFWRTVTYSGLVMLAIYSLTNYFYRELLS